MVSRGEWSDFFKPAYLLKLRSHVTSIDFAIGGEEGHIRFDTWQLSANEIIGATNQMVEPLSRVKPNVSLLPTDS